MGVLFLKGTRRYWWPEKGLRASGRGQAQLPYLPAHSAHCLVETGMAGGW